MPLILFLGYFTTNLDDSVCPARHDSLRTILRICCPGDAPDPLLMCALLFVQNRVLRRHSELRKMQSPALVQSRSSKWHNLLIDNADIASCLSIRICRVLKKKHEDGLELFYLTFDKAVMHNDQSVGTINFYTKLIP
jgi:hypothetical protein